MIRELTTSDFDKFWPTFRSIVIAQETYAFDTDINRDNAEVLWCELPMKTFVFEEGDQILGSYYIKANAMGPGSHVCNCGYMVSEHSRGKGIARLLCEHSQSVAIELGFRAMQFNSVVSSNTIAVKLWQKLGFEIVGTLPDAYQLKSGQYVDSYVMFKQLVK